ncbi:MAG: ABC transporter permease [Phycisphaerales bacterium]
MTAGASQSPKQAPGARRAVRRLAGAQEAGLLLVITLMVLALTFFGGTKTVYKPVVISPGATIQIFDADGVSHEPGTLPGRLIARIVVNGPDGSVQGYDAPLRYTETSGTPSVFVQDEVSRFLEKDNITLVLKDASFFAVMAVGMTAVIILAGIDLSVGSIFAFAAIVGALVLNRMGSDLSLSLAGLNVTGLVAVLVGLGVCVGIGALCGAANGVMTVGLRVHPFVITLGMMAALRGLTIIIPQAVTGEQSVSGFPPGFQAGFFKREILEVHPVPIVIMAVVAVVGWFILSRTVLGRRVYAIGGNETAARYAGIPVGRVKIIVYTIMGALAGLSACMAIGYLGAAETSAGTAYELEVIAAAVIGGASLMGGRGSALGAVLGAVVIKLIGNSMIIFDIDQSWNQVVMGGAIVVAVVIDQTKTRLSAG